jgi:hypothetical protein
VFKESAVYVGEDPALYTRSAALAVSKPGFPTVMPPLVYYTGIEGTFA